MEERSCVGIIQAVFTRSALTYPKWDSISPSANLSYNGELRIFLKSMHQMFCGIPEGTSNCRIPAQRIIIFKIAERSEVSVGPDIVA